MAIKKVVKHTSIKASDLPAIAQALGIDVRALKETAKYLEETKEKT